jgi:repressor LexA
MGSGDKLSSRQQQVLDFLRRFIRENGYPPSVREIGEAVGLSSPSSVHSHLQILENKGRIRRDASSARAIAVLEDDEDAPMAKAAASDPSVIRLPVLGQVAAGAPILAEQNFEDSFALPTQLVDDRCSFMLTVRGDSMIDAGILDGDYVVVREQPTADNGDIVVALLEDEATVKTFYKEKDKVRLQPQNQSMSPIYATDVRILGKVVALLRSL